MLSEYLFEPMAAQQVREKLATLANADLVAVTLTTGDILLGGVSERRSRNGVFLSFNTAAGKRYGHSHFVEVPFDSVADISLIPLDEASTPRMNPEDPETQALKQILGEELLLGLDLRIPVHNYPNPLASIVYRHNMQVLSSHGLTVGDFVERALSQEAIPIEGITFNDDCLLYADWPSFSQQARGTSSATGSIAGVLGVTVDLSQSARAQVIQRLRGSLADRIRRKTSPIPGERALQGRILVPEDPETTAIEGEECVLCAVDQGHGKHQPVLIKLKCLAYPLEFLGQVRSVLTFYGVSLTIPVSFAGREYQRTLLAQAIGYLHTE